MEKSRDVEKDIIEAARKVFVSKGFSRATMRDIAKEANINIAMLHYYFRSKENLFDIIFEEAFNTILNNIFNAVNNNNNSLFEKIESIITQYITTLIANPYLPNFIFNEITQTPERLGKKIKDSSIFVEMFKKFSEDIDSEIKNGTIRQINTITLFMNIISMCVFPFLAKPIVTQLFDMNEEQYNILLEARKKIVTDFVINSIKIK